MVNETTYSLKSDPGYVHLIAPKPLEERLRLEKSLLQDGCREAVSVWCKTIVDGHLRYEICQRHQLPFSVKQVYFRNREEALVWICTQQLERQDLPEEMRKYLIGRRYNLESILGAHNVAAFNRPVKVRMKLTTSKSPYGLTSRTTRDKLGEEYCVSDSTIMNYGQYAAALDRLNTIVPELVKIVLLGELKISQKNLIILSRLSGSDIPRLKELVAKNILLLGRGADIRKHFPERLNDPMKEKLTPPSGSIKEMPAYDPDAGISSLALTIPAWISSINRTRSNTKLYETSSVVREKLEQELHRMNTVINTMLIDLREARSVG